METLYPSLLMTNREWYRQGITEWTKEENKRFERALAIYDEDEPDRWIKVAAMIPGKSVFDVIKQYRALEEDVSDIEAGKVPIPGYDKGEYRLEWVDDRNFDEFRKRPLASKTGGDHERKKGVPWTEDEHRRFLVGLLKHGKGDWRNISRNFVVSKTPTQVASHAQKYFIRQQLSGVKDKRRPSIHDITTVNFADPNLSDAPNKPASVDHRRHHHQPSNALNLFHQTTSDQMQQHMSFDWSYSKDGSFMFFDSNDANDFGFKFQGPSLYAAAPNLNPRGLVFQRYPIHG